MRFPKHWLDAAGYGAELAPFRLFSNGLAGELAGISNAIKSMSPHRQLPTVKCTR